MAKDEEGKGKVTDIKGKPEDETEEARPAANIPPTHWAIPIVTMQEIVKYLKKQPMEDVESFVNAIQQAAVPLALQANKPPQLGG